MTKKEANKIIKEMMFKIDDLTDQLKEIKKFIQKEYYYSIKGFLKAAGNDMDIAEFCMIEPD